MIVKIYDENPNPKEMDKIVETLKNGGIIIYPTDTVYAIGCDALNVRAVEEICKIRNINPTKALFSIICYDLSNISEYTKVDNDTFKLMKRNLPGAFTFILNITSSLPKLYKNRKTVGIRIPDNNIAREIVRLLGNPIITSSLKNNDQEEEYTTDPELIHEKYGDRVDIVVDGGYGGIEPSTIVDCTGDKIEITRQGKGELLL